MIMRLHMVQKRIVQPHILIVDVGHIAHALHATWHQARPVPTFVHAWTLVLLHTENFRSIDPMPTLLVHPTFRFSVNA